MRQSSGSAPGIAERGSWRRRAFSAPAFLSVGALSIVVYDRLPAGWTVVGAILYFAIGLAAVAALTFGTLLKAHPLRPAWALIAASQAVWASADLLWSLLDMAGRLTDPSVADVFYVAGYILLAVGLALMLRLGTQRRDWGDIVDVAIIAVAAALVLWPFVFEPTVELGWTLSNFAALAYSAGDVLLLALLAALFFDAGRRTVSVSLMVGAVSLVFAADLVYYVPVFAEGAAVDRVTNAAWLGGYILLGAAGLHRSARAGAISSGATVDSPLRRLRFIGVALFALPCGGLLDELVGDGFAADDYAAFLAANAAVAVLVVLRTGLLLHAVERARRVGSAAQSRFESVFKSAGLGIVIARQGRMVQTNHAFQELVGYTGEELARMPPSSIIHPEDGHDIVEEEVIVRSGRAMFLRRYIHRSGAIVQTQITLTAAPEEDFAVAVIEDITRRTELEVLLRDAQKLEAVGRLAGGVAHDFNNVLTVVSGHAELLREEVSGQQGQDDITVILDAVRRASDLTRQLLAFSRVQELEPVVLDAADVVRETEVLLDRVIGKFVHLETSIEDRAPLVSADPVQLGQVLLNLAVNARDAMPDGGTLGIRVEELDTTNDLEDHRGVAPGRYCRIRVSDTGTGIAEATQERIFEPFFTTKEVGKGTGLGLATTYGIVKQSGGHIFVDSQLGHGTTFEILLPAAIVADAQLTPLAA